MAKKTYAEEVKTLLQSGEAKAVASNKFTKDGEPIPVRSMESASDPLQEGDTFVIPVDYQVIEVKIGEDWYPCVPVELKEADGTIRLFKFFPNSLCKAITPIIDGHRGPKVKTSGTATTLYRTVNTVDEGLALLKGKTIKVSKSTVYTIKDFNKKVERDTHIYVYDLVG